MGHFKHFFFHKIKDWKLFRISAKKSRFYSRSIQLFTRSSLKESNARLRKRKKKKIYWATEREEVELNVWGCSNLTLSSSHFSSHLLNKTWFIFANWIFSSSLVRFRQAWRKKNPSVNLKCHHWDSFFILCNFNFILASPLSLNPSTQRSAIEWIFIRWEKIHRKWKLQFNDFPREDF